jgi:hypothetical protein
MRFHDLFLTRPNGPMSVPASYGKDGPPIPALPAIWRKYDAASMDGIAAHAANGRAG